MAKTGRNDPCPCGSGKKYKKCCLRKDEERVLAGRPEAPTDDLFEDLPENPERFQENGDATEV